MTTLHGTVTHNNNELILSQNAYINDAGTHYIARAKDRMNNGYTVSWEITNFETENEDECCDWDDYLVTSDS